MLRRQPPDDRRCRAGGPVRQKFPSVGPSAPLEQALEPAAEPSPPLRVACDSMPAALDLRLARSDRFASATSRPTALAARLLSHQSASPHMTASTTHRGNNNNYYRHASRPLSSQFCTSRRSLRTIRTRPPTSMILPACAVKKDQLVRPI